MDEQDVIIFVDCNSSYAVYFVRLFPDVVSFEADHWVVLDDGFLLFNETFPVLIITIDDLDRGDFIFDWIEDQKRSEFGIDFAFVNVLEVFHIPSTGSMIVQIHAGIYDGQETELICPDFGCFRSITLGLY